ncbi:Amidase domain containing protein [Pyrenophora tritici-repentis]|uniref:amidase n=2 Tax=Pyrenophora tritici-repentis TaxID=45151 RepID=A0A5M9KV86_9PLEO|nr:acetamidase [Pyrenophora tritici-repentis Pt-1C-BFP]KAA8613901.1 Amidase domain-containing protein [Pyrenophora tritici-repentis]EDU49711.1 acetamidase [Pyrenophora tritici-repentis Pt-1C-BFP]KAG9380005.1 Amidase domain containing protein [Pyrenophora tritici-repentis]KAI1509695.1 Amidase [Pyrenophora tritici-repentis]KAI1526842.1 Amidase domain containing protein [Pyrenophora tritici-repentis]
MATPSWQEIATQKREATLAAIPAEWRLDKLPSIEKQVDVTEYVKQYFDKKELDITESSADVIAKKVAEGQWSAVEVTKAFCHRAAVGHQLLHCLHEIFFDAAIEDAKALDAYYAQHKKTIGPLHGVPVSLKDQFHVKGVETSMGYVGWIGTFEGKKGTGKEKVFESEMVKMLRNAGAVLYCKTSVPHTLMSGETVNNIIGYTLNPKNRHLTAGGSSGGEGALIGIRGSPIGLGTDIGGSIRIPAAFNGLYGLRPSTGRLPYEGMANSMDGQNTILSVVGPLATNAASLRLITQAILDQTPWYHDPFVHEIPWRPSHDAEIKTLKPLCFGVLRTDGVVNPTPPVRRAIEEVVAAVRAAGYKVIDWTPPSHRTLVDTGMNSWIYDGGSDVRSAFALSGEPMSPQVSFYASLTKEFTASEIAANNVALRRLKKEYMEYWNSTVQQTGTGRPVDAVITPLAPFPAARRERYKYYGYSSFVNVLDYTSVIVPVTRVDKGVDKKVEAGYQAIDEQDQMHQDDCKFMTHLAEGGFGGKR